MSFLYHEIVEMKQDGLGKKYGLIVGLNVFFLFFLMIVSVICIFCFLMQAPGDQLYEKMHA